MHLRFLERGKPKETWQMCSTVGQNSPSLLPETRILGMNFR